MSNLQPKLSLGVPELQCSSGDHQGTPSMPNSIGSQSTDASEGGSRHILTASEKAELSKEFESLFELLPFQGPISAFVFLNPLMGFEDLPFATAVQKGETLFGGAGYLSEERYHIKREAGRILPEFLSEVLQEMLGPRAHEPVGPSGTRQSLYEAMLQRPIRSGSKEEITWLIEEGGALSGLGTDITPQELEMYQVDSQVDRFGDAIRKAGSLRGKQSPRTLHPSQPESPHTSVSSQSTPSIALAPPAYNGGWDRTLLERLWQTCCQQIDLYPEPVDPAPRPMRPRDQLFASTGIDPDELVHEVLIRFCAAFVDQGLSGWTLPSRNSGFFASFLSLYATDTQRSEWFQEAIPELQRLRNDQTDALDSINASLEDLGIERSRWRDFLMATLVPLRGWAAQLWQLESRGDRVAIPVPKQTAIEFLAIRLILDRAACRYLSRQERTIEIGQNPIEEFYVSQRNKTLRSVSSAVKESTSTRMRSNCEQRALVLFQVAQRMSWTPEALEPLSSSQWRILLDAIDGFGVSERQRVFHQAFESQYRRAALNAIAAVPVRNEVDPTPPRFQAIFCIDAREESFRRHLEEVCPEAETFGTAGFFGIPIYYRGLGDAHFSTLCPIVVKPRHWIVEDAIYTQEMVNRRRQRARQAFGKASHRLTEGTRGFASGAILTGGMGVLASIPLVASVLFPRLTSRLMNTATRWLEPPRASRLRLERSTIEPGPDGDGIGFSLEEMQAMAERALRDIGLTRRFARLVLIFGHGSYCLNNPHKSAYDCGACSGSAGGPNARALASMLNDYRVRQYLANNGIEIPHGTIFIGALHNTGDDSIKYFDLDTLPITHQREFEFARQTLDETCERNSHERCRRFFSAPLSISSAMAHQHAEARTVDLAQTRPEFGNATNAICFVGRRQRTRGLFLDRRSFMASYDVTQDDAEFTILGRILGAVVPVCSGINLQYYFSYIDPAQWGAGTKLPHNVTSLLGVMDGAMSDLRGGLPWQGVEIHEPMRLLFVIEAPADAIRQIMARNPTVKRIIFNGWVQLALLDPDSGTIQHYHNDVFEAWKPSTTALPKVTRSRDWYSGRRDHLGFARIVASPNQSTLSGEQNAITGSDRIHDRSEENDANSRELTPLSQGAADAS